MISEGDIFTQTPYMFLVYVKEFLLPFYQLWCKSNAFKGFFFFSGEMPEFVIHVLAESFALQESLQHHSCILSSRIGVFL